MAETTPRQALDQLLVRALQNPRTTIAGLVSFVSGCVGVVTGVYFPGSTAPKMLIAASGLAGFITTTLAKDK